MVNILDSKTTFLKKQHNTNFPPCRMVVGVDTSLTSNGSEVHGIYVEYEYDISHQVIKVIISFSPSVVFMLVCLEIAVRA